MIQKTVEATGDLVGNKIVDKVRKISKIYPKNNSETNEEKLFRERYIFDFLRLKKGNC